MEEKDSTNGWAKDKKTDSAQHTFHEWLDVSTYYIELLSKAIDYYKFFLRYNAALGIILSTLTGTISVAQYSNYGNLLFSILLTTMSYVVAVSAGFMKIYQIQEQLEEYIKIRQEWVDFSINIITEIQVPPKLRKRVEDLIIRYKEKYTTLLKKDVYISDWIRSKVKTPFVSDGMGNFHRLETGKLSSILSFVNNSKRPESVLNSIKVVEDYEHNRKKISTKIKKLFNLVKETHPDIDDNVSTDHLTPDQIKITKEFVDNLKEGRVELPTTDKTKDLMEECKTLRRMLSSLERPENIRLPPSPKSSETSHEQSPTMTPISVLQVT
jgi:hypothetical protein